MANRKFLLIAVPAVIIVAGFAIYRYKSNFELRRDTTVPEVRLNEMEPQVADKIRRLEQEVKANPKSPEAWGKLAMTLQVHGLHEDSVPCYQEAAKLAPQDFRWPYLCAIALKEGGSNKAGDWFSKAIDLKSGYAPVQIRYARLLFESGQINESGQHFRQALQIDPNSADANVGLAQIAMTKGAVQQAVDYAEQAIRLNPKQGEAYSLLAILYRRLNQPDKAAQALSVSKQLPEKTAMVDPVYSALVAEGESAFWYRTRGRTYMDAGLYVLAIREFETALKLHEDSDAYDNLGAAYQGLGKWQEALEYHEKAIALNPNYLKYCNLGIAYAKLERLPEAIEAFQNSIRLNPDYAEAYYNLGVAYFKLSRWPDAISNLKLAVEKNPNHARAHYALAMTYLSAGDQHSALKEYEILRKLDPALANQMGFTANR